MSLTTIQLVPVLHHAEPTAYLKAILGVGALYLLYFVYDTLSDPLRHVPGPKWARISRLWLFKEVLRGDVEKTQIDLHKRHGETGTVVRLAPGHYSINDPDAFRTIYAHGSKYVKSDFYDAFGPPDVAEANVFTTRDPVSHAAQRKKIAGLYSMTALLSYEPFVDQANANLISRLTRMAEDGEPFEMTRWIQYYAFDVIGAITVGTPFGFLENGYDVGGILSEIKASIKYGSRIGTLGSWLHPVLASMAPLIGRMIPRQAIQKYVLENIEHKRRLVESGETTEEHTGKQDFLEKLFVMKEKGKVNDFDIQNAVGANINAGSDTTSVSLSGIFYHLIRNPEAMEKLRAEINTNTDAGNVSSPITFKEAQTLPYLQAVIKEGLRLHPAVGRSLTRVVPAGGATLAGYFFPAGTVVGTNAWVMSRNTDAFGPDADKFRPERWLESPERSRQMDHYFFSFGGGARVCIGKNISMLEINKVLPNLVMKFDFVLERPEAGLQTENLFLMLQKYKCFVKLRKEVEA